MSLLNKRIWPLLVAMIVLAPSTAHAHAHLLRSEPADRARVRAAPRVIQLSFSERPELAMSFAELKDSNGTSYSLGPALHSDKDKLGVEFAIRDSLPSGHYTLQWRTAASDGHPSHGQLTFDVVPAIESPGTSAPEAISDSVVIAMPLNEGQRANPANDDDHAASIPNSLARALLFIALLVLIGAVTFALVILPNSANVDPVSRETMLARSSLTGMAAAMLVAAAALLRLYLETTMMTSMPDMPGMAGMTTQDMVVHTTWGLAFLLQLASAIVVLIAFALAARRIVWAWYLAAAGALVLAITPALSGHAAAAPNLTAFVVISDWLHVLAGGAWLGSLFCVMAIGVPVACTCEGDERWTCVSSIVRMFSRIAMLSVATILISGVFASWVHLTAISDLWTTTYGKTLLAKILLAACALSTGAFNFKRVQPQLPSENGTQRLRRSATLELAAGFAILIITGFLTGLSH